MLPTTSLDADSDGAGSVPVWGRWEEAFRAGTFIDDPTSVQLVASLTAPDGSTHEVPGFWDGDQRWKVRFMPDAAGTWHYEIRTRAAIEGLHGRTGTFTAGVVTDTTNRFLKHGALRLSNDGHHLVHDDGTPFFWLADTAWNGALRSSADDWERYLTDRASKRFTGIQFVTTQWRGAQTDRDGQTAYHGYDNVQIHPPFFQRLDKRVDAVNEAGLLAIPVLLWTLGDVAHTPGKLPRTQAVRLARYITARYGAHHTIWFLTGDEHFSTAWMDRWAYAARAVVRQGPQYLSWLLNRPEYFRDRRRYWRRTGRAVFSDPQHRTMATAHPRTQEWNLEPFRSEDWYDLLVYQSSHGGGPDTLRWIHSGPPAEHWSRKPALPVINAEPGYEDLVAWNRPGRHTAFDVRQQAYYSLLAAPPAGVSYGAHGVWSWETEPSIPRDHPGTGRARPWDAALHFPGGEDLGHLAELLISVKGHQLRPDPLLVSPQPGTADPAAFAAAARTETGDRALIYLPTGGEIAVRIDSLATGLQYFWFDPRTGRRTDEAVVASRTFTAPDQRDWLLVLAQ